MTQRLSRTLRVLPNPYCSLDVDGDPSGALPRADMRGKLIGARIDQDTSAKAKRVKYVFRDDVVQVPDIDTHRNYVRSGQLFAADEPTAKLCGVDRFVAPAALLEEAKRAAAHKFLAETGELPPFARPAAPAGDS